MPYSQEKTIYIDFDNFFFRCTFFLHKDCSFHSVLAEKIHSLMFPEYLNIWSIHYLHLHYFGCSEYIPPYDQIDFTAEACQISCLFSSRITSTDNCNILSFVKKTVAGSTTRDPHTCIFFFRFKSKVLCCCTCCNYHSIRFN